TSNVTVLGDAVHTMTPGRGVGANTALEDAALLCKRLVEVRDGEKEMLDALRAYEAQMLQYSRVAVLESRKQMDARDPIHRPVLGRVLLALMRTSMRIVNAIPALKNKMRDSQLKLRKIKDQAALGQRAQLKA
ncbi:MAG TPA: FAD-dependent monooxygenase, partial [Edaphobacter sp.]